MRWRRLGVISAVGAFLVISGLMRSGEAQIPPGVPLPPGFSIPSIPTTVRPPTTGTTEPPPTMPPSSTTTTSPGTTSPPPTMPPTTRDLGDPFDEQIQSIIDQLRTFGEQFAHIIEDLQALQNRF